MAESNERRWTPIGELANLLQLSFLNTVFLLRNAKVDVAEDSDRFAMEDLIDFMKPKKADAKIMLPVAKRIWLTEAMQYQETECAPCAAKPGSPTLCESCLSNRREISALKNFIKDHFVTTVMEDEHGLHDDEE